LHENGKGCLDDSRHISAKRRRTDEKEVEGIVEKGLIV
jgi:hypothetical protein